MPNGIKKEVVYFIGEALEDKVNIQNQEIQEYRWLNYNVMLPLITFPKTREVLMRARSFLNE